MGKENESDIKKSSSMTRIFRRILHRTDSSSDEEDDVKKYELPVTLVLPGDLKTTMKDIGGYDEAKLEVIEFINFLHNKEHYIKLGARVPKGALLYGPPGTGKTLLARACAGEGNIPFISCASASFLVDTNGPKKLRKVFKLARKVSPCILFFDEIDCIGRARGDFQSTPQSQSMTEELLVQLDGFEEHRDKIVVVFGATNSYDELDLALKRPGRFDRSIEMPQPDIEARIDIARVHLAPLKTSLDKNTLARKIAMLTVGFTGAQIASLCNESAMIAARNSAEEIAKEHFDKAFDRVKFGLKKDQPLADNMKKVAAYHEAGHVIAGWYLPNVKPVTKASVMPNASGCYACSMDAPGGFRLLTQKEDIMDIAVVHMAGMASEKVVLGSYGTAGGVDIKEVTTYITHLSAEFGLFKSFGKLNVSTGFNGLWNDADCETFISEMDMKCGDKTFESAFRETSKVINEAFEKAERVCSEHREELDKVASALMEKENLYLEDLEAILGKIPGSKLSTLTLEDRDFLPEGLRNWNQKKGGG